MSQADGKCRYCKGAGKVPRLIGGAFHVKVTCPQCHGDGKFRPRRPYQGAVK